MLKHALYFLTSVPFAQIALPYFSCHLPPSFNAQLRLPPEPLIFVLIWSPLPWQPHNLYLVDSNIFLIVWLSGSSKRSWGSMRSNPHSQSSALFQYSLYSIYMVEKNKVMLLFYLFCYSSVPKILFIPNLSRGFSPKLTTCWPEVKLKVFSLFRPICPRPTK